MTKEIYPDSNRQLASQAQTASKPPLDERNPELQGAIVPAHPSEIEREFRGLVPHPE